jgi:hypothetical protein
MATSSVRPETDMVSVVVAYARRICPAVFSAWIETPGEPLA